MKKSFASKSIFDVGNMLMVMCMLYHICTVSLTSWHLLHFSSITTLHRKGVHYIFLFLLNKEKIRVVLSLHRVFVLFKDKICIWIEGEKFDFSFPLKYLCHRRKYVYVVEIVLNCEFIGFIRSHSSKVKYKL